MEFARLLAAVDVGPRAEAIVRRSFDLARFHKARLSILHVVDQEPADAAGELFDLQARTSLCDGLRADAHRDIERLVESLDPGPGSVDIIIEEGAPFLVLVDIAERLKADLIVMGLNERRSFRERIIGSTTDRVLHLTRPPVLVVKRPFQRRYRLVVAATDFSRSSETAAETLATLCPDARLRLVHAAHVPVQFDQVLIRAGTGQEGITAFHRSVVAKASIDLSSLDSRFRGREPEVESEVIEGEPVETLLNISRSRHVDLIGLGMTRRAPPLQVLLGSTARNVLRAAACDVFVVRPES